MEQELIFLDRNEFNYSPSEEVIQALKDFDIKKLCFYTRIYDEGKKSIFSVFLSELYGVDESQVLLGYGGINALPRHDWRDKTLMARYFKEVIFYNDNQDSDNNE